MQYGKNSITGCWYELQQGKAGNVSGKLKTKKISTVGRSVNNKEFLKWFGSMGTHQYKQTLS